MTPKKNQDILFCEAAVTSLLLKLTVKESNYTEKRMQERAERPVRADLSDKVKRTLFLLYSLLLLAAGKSAIQVKVA